MDTTNVGKAVRHECLSKGTLAHCTKGDGKPRRKACAGCGGRLAVYPGTWGVFVWTGTGRYPLTDAVRTFVRERAAERFTEQDERYVVRWVPAT